MKALLAPVFAFAISLAAPVASEEITPSDLDDPARFAGAAVVVLGEVHDNPRHHNHQARAVATVAPRALVFEMLPPGVTASLPDPLPGPSDLSRLLGWDAQGWPDFAMYHPIFAAAPTARIYGAEIPRELARRAMADGSVAVFGPEAATFGLTRPLAPDDQALREAEQAEAHCNALPPDLLPGMVEVQRLRDASLARAALAALRDTGGPVAVITGTGHARRDHGLPAALALAAPEVTVLALGQFEDSAPAEPPFDLWLVTPPWPREDPCKALMGG